MSYSPNSLNYFIKRMDGFQLKTIKLPMNSNQIKKSDLDMKQGRSIKYFLNED